MMRRPMTWGTVLCVAMLCAGCTAKAPYRQYQPGAFSADAGEAMYQAFYRAHQQGYVGKDAWTQYDRAYAETVRAQHAYRTALERGEETTDEKHVLETWVKELLGLAYAHGIY